MNFEIVQNCKDRIFDRVFALSRGAVDRWLRKPGVLALALFSVAMTAIAPGQALAWWNKDWTHRQQITVDTTQSGALVQQPLSNVPLVVRLHPGNMTFDTLRGDGADLRFIAADDQTPLPFAIERFDPVNQLAIVRVLAPMLSPNRRTTLWTYYGNPKASAASDGRAVQDKDMVLAYDFEGMKGAPRDRTAYGNNASRSTAAPTPAGALGDAASFTVVDSIVTPASPSLQFSAEKGVTITAWIRSDRPQSAALFTLGDPAGRSLSLSLDHDKLVAQTTDEAGRAMGTAVVGALKLDGWRHLAVTLGGGALTVFVDGEQKVSTPTQALSLSGPFTISGLRKGELGFTGAMDEVELSRGVRSADWIRTEALGAGPEGRLTTVGPAEAKSANPYLAGLRTIASSVSVDGWVVIGIVVILGLVGGEAAIRKTVLLGRIKRADARFLEAESDRGANAAIGPEIVADSPLYRIHQAATAALAGVARSRPGRGVPAWSAALSDVIRSAIARTTVDEAALLNRNMVLLTLAISGGPFLGLLGTVVGVMTTFASIAAAGDVNVNTIAPGIAAAITATVSGLLIAIPALFAYNILMSRIREKMNSLEIYGEDLLSRMAFNASMEKVYAA
jgi:biopolymer transport protein ExbB